MFSTVSAHIKLKQWVLSLATALLLCTVIFPNIPEIQVSTSNKLPIEPEKQRKDTYLLCLGTGYHGPPQYRKGCPLEGACGWDRPHLQTCEHGSLSCVRACIKMIVSKYGANLSQDRISIHIFEEIETPFKDGQPENDLGHKQSVSSLLIAETLSWALNNNSITFIESKPTFTEIKEWIDEGRPILRRDSSGSWHATIVSGYDTNDELVYVIDPASGTETAVSYETLPVYQMWVPPADANPRSDEPSIHTDFDLDGVIDFDEINRFFTDPYNPDSDFDGVPDKAEIISYTFLSDGSFDSEDVRKPDSDNDGLRAELDNDSDNGGLPDGMEDINHNGKVDIGETDPFDPEDDPIVEYPVANFTWFPQMAWINETITFNATQCYSPNGNITWYAWNFEDENLAATQEPFINHTYQSEGRYNVTVEVTDEKFLKASTSNIVEVTYRTDLDKDGIVNIRDLFIVARAFGSHGPDIPNPGDPASEKWNSVADVNKDGWISIKDLFEVAKDYGKTV